MRLILAQRIEFDSRHDAAELAALLRPPVAEGWLAGGGDDVPFCGTVRADGFAVHRRIRNRNSFRPVVVGTWMPSAHGTHVSIRMRLHRLVAAFCLVWLGGLLFWAAAAIVMSVARGELGGVFFGVAAPLAFLPVFGGLVLAGFWYEAEKARALLAEVFDEMPG